MYNSSFFSGEANAFVVHHFSKHPFEPICMVKFPPAFGKLTWWELTRQGETRFCLIPILARQHWLCYKETM